MGTSRSDVLESLRRLTIAAAPSELCTTAVATTFTRVLWRVIVSARWASSRRCTASLSRCLSAFSSLALLS
jgi:hypothetical protein